jgi:predicted DNA-binding protein
MHLERATQETTILLTPSLHQRLTRLARQRGTSMGQLIRRAVEAQHGLVEPDERLAAVAALAALSLPVDTPAAMKAESIPYDGEPVP